MGKIEGLVILKPVSERMCAITARHWSWNLLRWGGFHKAYDWAPYPSYFYRLQEPVAGIDSRVVQIYDEPDGFGLYTKLRPIRFPDLLYFKAHLASVYVKEGQIVEARQKIGIMGHSGRCYSRFGGDPTHLHDELRKITRRGEYRRLDLARYYKSWAYSSESFRA